MPAEKVRLRIGNVANAVLVTGQAYQDPRDALNEFVSNAADEYAISGQRGERIRVVLRRRGRHPVIAVEDYGRGMDADRLRQVARQLFNSSKVGDRRTLGEKAIGILAFQQLGGRCDIATRVEGAPNTVSLRLERGRATAQLDLNEKRRARAEAGTTVYLSDLDPDVLRVLTQRKVVDYLRRRRGPALAKGDYTIEVVEGRAAEIVTAEEPDGVRIDIPAQPTLWGRMEFSLFVAARPDKHRRVAVVGRAGTTIIDDLSELDEFAHGPWTSDQVSGQVLFEPLEQSAGRRAILRDRSVFPVFVSGVAAIEPLVARTLERVAREVDTEMADRLSDVVRRVFGKVLRELADLDNPMRTLIGSTEGDGALLVGTDEQLDVDRLDRATPEEGPPEIRDLTPRVAPPLVGDPPEGSARPDPHRARALPSVEPDPTPGDARSRFDPGAGIVFYNDAHSDYLFVKDDESSLLDYLATLVAKEYVVYNNPRASSDELAEEMVRMLVRVRHHLPRRR